MRLPGCLAACLLLPGCGVFLDPTYERYLVEGLAGLEGGLLGLDATERRVAHLAAANEAGQAMVWDRPGGVAPWRVAPLAEGGAPLAEMSMGEGALALSFRPTSPATWCLDNEVRVYSLAERAPVASMSVPGCLLGMQLLEEPAGNAWLIGAEKDPDHEPVGLFAYDLRVVPPASSRTEILSLGNRSDAYIRACPSASLLALHGPGGTPWSLHRYSPDPQGLTSVWAAGAGEYPPGALAFDRTCSHLAIVRIGLDEVEVHAVDGMDGLPEARIHVDGLEEGASLAFSPDGALLAVGLTRGTGSRRDLEPALRVFEWRTGRQIFEVIEAKAVHALAFEADGRRLASASDSGSVKLWDMERIRADAGL